MLRAGSRRRLARSPSVRRTAGLALAAILGVGWAEVLKAEPAARMDADLRGCRSVPAHRGEPESAHLSCAHEAPGAAGGTPTDRGEAAFSAQATGSDAPAFRAEARSNARRRRLAQREDEERPDEGLSVSLLGRSLRVSGAAKLRMQADRRLELDPSASDRTRFRPELEVEFFYPISERITAFAELELTYTRDVRRRERTGDSSLTLERGETWLRIDELFESPLGVQVGRQRFKDDREWWWDQNLDGVRMDYAFGDVAVELGFARELGRTDNEQELLDPEERGLSRLLGHVSWRYAKRHSLEAFALRQADRSPSEPEGKRVDRKREDVSDADLTWLGLRASGRFRMSSRAGDLRYWADLAIVRGDEEFRDFDTTRDGRRKVDEIFDRSVRGQGLDLGLTWQPGFADSLYLTLGYALGSGPDGDDDEDEQGFRQTGIHDNRARFGGVDRFRYYGELFDPELSNLSVQTLAVGWRPLRATSIDLVLHSYRQMEAIRELPDARLRARPTGDRRALGREIDLVLAWEESERLRLKLIGAQFRAGSAFGSDSGELSRRGELELEWVY